MKVPYGFEQHGARHHPVGVAHEVFQKLKLASRQFHAATAARDLASHDIDVEVAQKVGELVALEIDPKRACFLMEDPVGTPPSMS